jgi:acetylornithine deacetylase/succinyl-diaminopimelate desuccinylase-like protein
MNQADIDTILASITPERCTEITCELVNVPSLTGNERPIAETCVRLLRDMGIEAVMQEFEPDRYNCIGRIRGTGGGPTLLFNGHMDISFNGDEQYLPDAPGYRTKALVKDGFIHGMGVHNMKSGVGAFIAAAEAVKKSGLKLKGDLLLGFVGGEIERHSVLDYQGPSYRGGGCGTSHWVRNGGIADMAVVGEPTSMGLIHEHVGSVAVRITTLGKPAPLRVASHGDDAIRKMRVLIDVFDDFSADYSARHGYKGRQSSVHMHSIEGGWPFRCNRVPFFCHVFLEFRVLPSQRVGDIPQEVDRLIAMVHAINPSIEFQTEFFVTLPPALASGNATIADHVRAAHQRVVGAPPQEGVGMFLSDAGHLQLYGIPCVNYGPSGRTATGKENWDPDIGEHCSIEDLTRTAKVYAGVALEVCSKSRAELGLPVLKAPLPESPLAACRHDGHNHG